ncbi:hypothetical protein Metli_0828 [Methanofollis liminatans DSM 4140]|uniref:Uncharacterized protein n=1 Tax=Methanofollis liminatans DSM 4140 TaxID=28892 RepID=J1L189_9EURY|nr:hypothetical protein Metli_0828 [Methanofollis liminatans DSM 4140]
MPEIWFQMRFYDNLKVILEKNPIYWRRLWNSIGETSPSDSSITNLNIFGSFFRKCII